MRRRRGPAEPELPSPEVLDGPIESLVAYAEGHQLDMVELIKLRGNRRRATAGLAPVYTIGSFRR